jgi:arylsulfatase A-like enzyme
MNILLITLDQFRADCLGCAGHPLVQTPNLDRLSREGVRLAQHYSQAAPCGPGRASLYTGMYQMNHRVVANGTPLDARFDNIALAARRAGYDPTLFGYTDQSVDPRAVAPGDPRLQSYEGVLPGFSEGLHLPSGAPTPWIAWLRAKGYDVSDDAEAATAGETARPADVSMAAFVTDRFLDWHAQQKRPWFAHLSHLRPHPPYAAAGRYATMYDPASVPLPIPKPAEPEPFHAMMLSVPELAAPTDQAGVRHMRAQYYGMISEVDAQLGRVWAALEASGQWDDTFILVTADHGEYLGDLGLKQKAGYFPQSYHVLGLVRDPRDATAHGSIVRQYTENVDVTPTLCEAMGVPTPAQCDGYALTPFLSGIAPQQWRRAAHWEFDWRYVFIPHADFGTPRARDLDAQNLAVLRRDDAAYVHFGDGRHMTFDLAADQTWRTPLTDPARLLNLANEMLTWRARHLDRALTGTLIDKGIKGRVPD